MKYDNNLRIAKRAVAQLAQRTFFNIYLIIEISLTRVEGNLFECVLLLLIVIISRRRR